MSTATKRELGRIQEGIVRRAPLVERKLRQVGIQPDPAIVFSTAQYYDTLKKLAKK